MKNLLITIISIFITITFFSQTESDQNPNFEKSLIKYDLQKNEASAKQSITIQDTYEVKDWREVKTEQKELKAARKHELRKMRMEREAQNRRFYNQNNNRYYRSRRNCSPYYNY